MHRPDWLPLRRHPRPSRASWLLTDIYSCPLGCVCEASLGSTVDLLRLALAQGATWGPGFGMSALQKRIPVRHYAYTHIPGSAVHRLAGIWATSIHPARSTRNGVSVTSFVATDMTPVLYCLRLAYSDHAPKNLAADLDQFSSSEAMARHFTTDFDLVWNHRRDHVEGYYYRSALSCKSRESPLYPRRNPIWHRSSARPTPTRCRYGVRRTRKTNQAFRNPKKRPGGRGMPIKFPIRAPEQWQRTEYSGKRQ